VVGNGVIYSSIYAPQYWCKGKETDSTVTQRPLKTTLSGQSNTTIFYSNDTCFCLQINYHQAKMVIKKHIKMQYTVHHYVCFCGIPQ
jgi:hypothetical protein